MSNKDKRKHRHADLWEGFKKYAVQMGSEAMIYFSCFIKIGATIRMLVVGIYRHTESMDNS
jgi:hypothetical protein